MRIYKWLDAIFRIFIRRHFIFQPLQPSAVKIQKFIVHSCDTAAFGLTSTDYNHIQIENLGKIQQTASTPILISPSINQFQNFKLETCTRSALTRETTKFALQNTPISYENLNNHCFFTQIGKKSVDIGHISEPIAGTRIAAKTLSSLIRPNQIPLSSGSPAISTIPLHLRDSNVTAKSKSCNFAKISKPTPLEKQMPFPHVLLEPLGIDQKRLLTKKIQTIPWKQPAEKLQIRLSPTEESGTIAKFHNKLLLQIRQGLQFIGEIDPGPDTYNGLKIAIKDYIKQYRRPKEGVRRIWSKYPGACAAFLVLSGAYEYSHGEYWFYTLISIGIPPNPSYQRQWGTRFLQFINVYGLNAFSESGLRYVGPILGHSMIPNDCLPDFFEQILEPAIASPAWSGRSPSELITGWLNRSGSFPSVDKPVWQFLKYGGQTAIAWVTEALSIVKQRYETGLINFDKSSSLPTRIIEFYKEWLERLPAPPSSRSPFMAIDPISGLQLVFPDQRLSSEMSSQVCSWEIFAAGERMQGPKGYAQMRGKEAVFNAAEIILPPEGPYEIQLDIDGKVINSWTLNGLSSDQPWMLFSETTNKLINTSNEINGGFIWFLGPESLSIIARGANGEEQPGVIKQRHYMGEEWYGHKSILLDLTSAASIEITWDKGKKIIPVKQPEIEVKATGGDLLQSSENSPDHISLYGNTPPKIILHTQEAENQEIINEIKMRISGEGRQGSHAYEPKDEELLAGCDVQADQFVFDVRELVKPILCPGNLKVTVWFRGKRVIDFQFKWIPNLNWKWIENGRKLEITLPEDAMLTSINNGNSNGQHGRNNCCVIQLPENVHEMEAEVSWGKTSETVPFSVPIRLFGLRWAFLQKRSSLPVWHFKPLEMRPDDLLEEDSPFLMIESRDLKWKEINLSARWIGDTMEAPSVDLSTERLSSKDRWLIRLAETADTLRKFNNINSSVIVYGLSVNSIDKPIFEICLLKLQAPTSFRWKFQNDPDSACNWSEVCADVDIQDLLEASQPNLVFEVLGGDSFRTKICASWLTIGGEEEPFEIQANQFGNESCWHINLKQVLQVMEIKHIQRDSEVRIEILGPGIDEEITVMRIHQHFAAITSYEDCIKWAGDNRLHAYALDLLGALNHNRWTPKHDLEDELKISPDLIDTLLRIIRIECPKFTITAHQNRFKLSKETYKQIKSILMKWDQQRRWKG